MVQKKTSLEIGNWYDLGTFEIAYFEGDIYFARLKKDQILTLDCLKDSMRFREKHGIIGAYMILEFGEFSTVDLDARVFSMNRPDEPFKAEAYVTKNLAQRLIVDNYVRQNKRSIPFARFDTIEEAYSWIDSLKLLAK
jgi:hypothetical protein